MQKVPITQVEPGQVVARPVVSATGMLLVQPGTVLSADIIGRLLNVGVDCLWLEGLGPNAKSADVLLDELEQRFAGHEQDPLMMELEAVVAGCIRRGATDGHDG